MERLCIAIDVRGDSARRLRVILFFSAELLRTDRARGAARADHKARQLCRQVYQTLSLALAGECDDDVLRDLYIASVDPAPDSRHLVVRVVVRRAPDAPAPAEVLGRLDRAKPLLRRLIAQAITRKRVPEISFVPTSESELMP